MKRGYFFAFILAVVLCLPLTTQAANSNYVQKINYSLEQPFGGATTVQSWGEYIQLVYKFALGLVSIAAVVLIMVGGVRWIIAAGNESVIGEAKEMITSAVIGLVIALLSYSILIFINPALVQQNFSVAEIPIPGSDSELWNYDWCNATSPSIASKQCTSSVGDSKCSEVACGSPATYADGSSTKICRGAMCGADDAEPGCYHDPDNPTGEAACLYKSCGQWSDYCFKKFPDSSQHDDYSACLCEYYPNYFMKVLNSSNGSDLKAYNAQQLTAVSVACGENFPQDDFVAKIMADTSHAIYNYTGTEAYLKGYGVNCNFGCQMYNASTATTSITEVDLSSLSSVISWIADGTVLGDPNRVIECRKS